MANPTMLFLVNFIIEMHKKLGFEVPPIPLAGGAFINIRSLRDVLMEESADEIDILKHSQGV
jgi:hypothetical protein